MRALKSIFGEVRWTPPAWLHRLGLRKLLIGVGLAFALCAIALAAFRYYDSLPKPTRVVAEVVAPGITPVIDSQLKPRPLVINFSVKADPRSLLRTVNSVARIELVNEEIADGVCYDEDIFAF